MKVDYKKADKVIIEDRRNSSPAPYPGDDWDKYMDRSLTLSQDPNDPRPTYKKEPK